MLKYEVLENQELAEQVQKQQVIDFVSEYFDSDMIDLADGLKEAVDEDGLQAPKTFDQAVDIYHDYIDNGMEDSLADEIEQAENEATATSAIKDKIASIQNIIDMIEKDFDILNIETSHNSVSTYLKVKYSDKFSKMYDDNADLEYQTDGSEKSKISVRISDHYVGGNEFVGYTHSQYEWII